MSVNRDEIDDEDDDEAPVLQKPLLTFISGEETGKIDVDNDQSDYPFPVVKLYSLVVFP